MTGTHDFQVVSSRDIHIGRVVGLRLDEVAMPGGATAKREVVEHLGAVAVVALDDDGQVALIHQYRHPVGAHDWEIPAGLLDVEGEEPQHAAERELAEEADLVAARWERLLAFTPSPGSSDEVLTVFLATELSDVPPAERHHREHEEAGMPTGWVRIDDAVAAVLGGRVRNAPMMLSVLALAERLGR